VRDNTIHSMMPSAQPWLFAPCNYSIFGFAPCSQIALTYATLARAGDYDARVWEIYGHTVPEIFVNGRWELYDPDLASTTSIAADRSRVSRNSSAIRR
jgi:hypothetical protein